jgi:ABC-type transport system involved in cytochrome c biogenesis permease subunit
MRRAWFVGLMSVVLSGWAGVSARAQYGDAPAVDGAAQAADMVQPLAAMEAPELRIADVSEFMRIPVLHQGRKMPMHTYGRLFLLQLSGKSSYDDLSAGEWFTQFLFEPSATLDDRVFLINHPEVAQALGMPVREDRRYSFTDLHGGMARLGELARRAAELEKAQRSQVENELLRLYTNQQLYLDLYHSLEFARPHPAFKVERADLAAALNKPLQEEPFTYADLYQRVDVLQRLIAALPEKPPAEWTPLEESAYALATQLFEWGRRHQDSQFLLIPTMSHDEEVWMSVWDSFALGLRDAATSGLVQRWREMTDAYLRGQQVDFDIAARAYQQGVEQVLGDERALAFLDWEVRFNQWNLFGRAVLLYGFGLFLAIFTLMSASKWPYRVGGLLIVAAFVLHTVGMLMRMGIMGRPPMTNLYATFIFVSWVCAILGFVLELVQKNGLGWFGASVSGWLLLLFSRRFELQGDTMGQVVAVLDSNFWLSTHVTTVTAGYAGCLLAGVIAHLYLLLAVARPQDRKRLRAVQGAMMGMLAFGLTFAFLGTMLGGVWADQSWGRFWGWDPKENGALLIVLWSAILFHARLAGMAGPVALAAGNIVNAVIVMMAWLGVNLLGVGLHSYGFTSGLALNLFVYTAVELVFIAVFAPWAARRTAV